MSETQVFQAGDHVVYPGHGVGEITSVDSKEIMGMTQVFYGVQIVENEKVIKLLVPKSKVDMVGLRPIISKNEASKVIDILKQKEVKIDNQTWNRRYREYTEKIKTGSVYEIAEVLRDLFVLRVDKELSFGERNMLGKARSLLFKELSLATSEEELSSQEDVKAIFEL